MAYIYIYILKGKKFNAFALISVYKLTAQQVDDERTTADGHSHNS